MATYTGTSFTTVTVYNDATYPGVLATIYSDVGMTVPTANPFACFGRYTFYAAAGKYVIQGDFTRLTTGGSGTVTHTGTLTANELIVGNSGVDIKAVAATDGQIPIGKTSDGSVTLGTITAGSGISVTNGAAAITIATTGGASATIFPSTIEGRLTTETGVPISTSDRTAQGTIYYTPSTTSGIATTNGNITLYNGSQLVNQAYTQLSLGLTVTSGKNYDVFVDYNSGTPQLVLSAAWTNDTTRADALGIQSGIIIKSGTTAYRWVGTIRASGANVTADSQLHRFVWNAYNQLPRFLNVVDTTDTWTWNSASWHQANASSANQVDYVSGAAGMLVRAEVKGGQTAGSGQAGAVGVGIDVTNANSAQLITEVSGGAAAQSWFSPATYKGYPGLGYHFVAWLEYARAGTVTFMGDNGVADQQSGMQVEILG